MNFQLKKWFGDSIMVYIVDDHKNINKKIKKLILKDVEPDTGRFAKTTDKEEGANKDITDSLHTNKDFKDLFDKIKIGVYQYLESQEYRPDVFDVYITKAWATLTTKGQMITDHRHTASHFSLVYYVEAEDQGNLTFRTIKNGLFIPQSDEYYRNNNEHNLNHVTYASRTGDIIIFPSHLQHRTDVNTKDKPRISIGIDVLLTMKKGYTSEHNFPCPTTWKKL
jgi:uncharacterized protein (TIGR02466 family)